MSSSKLNTGAWIAFWGGEDLDPDQITRLLACVPTAAQKKGENIVRPNGQIGTIARRGMWRLCAITREPEDLDGQITELLSKMTPDLETWKSIATKYKVDLFCGIFLGGSNEGLSVTAQSLTALGLRQIELGLNIYERDKKNAESSAI